MNQIDLPENIDQVKKVHVSEIEPLYWIVEDALYENKLKRAKDVYSLLACIAKHNKPVLIEGLHPEQLDRLQQIAHELYDGEMSVLRKSVEIRFPIAAKLLPFKKERELENYLMGHPEILSEAFEETIRIRGQQVETDFEYACDLVAESNQIFYPIELKIRQSNHEVISQIDKYCFYFYRKLRYNQYKKIQGVVIANGFDSFAINQLRKNNISIYEIVPIDNKDIRLRRVQ